MGSAKGELTLRGRHSRLRSGSFWASRSELCSLTWLTVASGQGQLREGVTWKQIWALSALAGVGFTLSTVISELAFY